MGMELIDSESISRPDNSRLFYSAIARGKYELFAKADQTILDAPGIYCIFNSESNMLYIGCSVNVKSRISSHKTHLSKGIHVCRLMTDDYQRNPDSFRFFPITYIDESNFTLPESIRNHLFYLENQHMKRVPLAALYNGLMPASLSEKLLLSEQPKRPQGVPITEIINRLGMSVDSIKTNGFSLSDILPHEKAIEFLQKRTFASGRFPEEKAAIAREFLAELQALTPSKNDDVDGLLIRGGVMDYFDKVGEFQQKIEDTAKFKNAIRWAEMKAAHAERAKKPPVVVKKALNWPLWIGILIPSLASAFNTYHVSHQITRDWWVALFLMALIIFTPMLFIAARVGFFGGIVAFGVVIFEGFCNLSAIYLSLMGNMEYILDGKRGVCSDFLQSVVNLTNSDHRPTAVLIGGALAALIALTQLTAFWAIRNRIK